MIDSFVQEIKNEMILLLLFYKNVVVDNLEGFRAPYCLSLTMIDR